MKHARTSWKAWAWLLLGAWLLVGLGCEDSEPAAEATWVIEVDANPASINVGPGEAGESQIIAVLFDETGVPKSGVGLRFSTSAGQMDSNGTPVITNSRGEARDRLVTNADAKVTVKSGSVEGTVDVTISQLDRPSAGIIITPSGQAEVGQSVQYSSAPSSSPNGQIIENRWTIISSLPGAPPDNETTSNTAISRVYAEPQNLTVTLTVVDELNLTDTTSELYEIVENLAPTAILEPGSQAGTVVTTNPYQCTAQISGCRSTDNAGRAGGRIAAFEVFWGDGRSDIFYQSTPTSPCQFSHTYRAPSGDLGYTVKLVAYDNGNGLTPECETPTTQAELTGCSSRQSDDDTAIVTCAAP